MARAFAAGMGAAFMMMLGGLGFCGLAVIVGRRAYRALDAKIGKSIRSIPIAMIRAL